MSQDIQNSESCPAFSTRRLRIMPRESLESLGHPDPLSLHPVTQQHSSTRQVSATFSTNGPPSSLPTVATSSLTASTTHGKLPMMHADPCFTRKFTPSGIPLPKASTVTTYETAMATNPQNDENFPPGGHTSGLRHKHKDSINIAVNKLRAKTRPQPLSTLTKSNTLNAISNLTASISRNSLSKFSRSTSYSSTAESEPRSSIASGFSAARTGSDSGNPWQIHTAQPSAYWTGRFMALEDRFHNEMLLPENMLTLVNAHAQQSSVPYYEVQVPAYMNASASTPNILKYNPKSKSHQNPVSAAVKAKPQLATGSLYAARIEDERDRARRVFLHLEALCTTSEARKSLHSWQQSYARQTRTEELLPRGGTMEDKGWMGRLLRRGSQDTGNRTSITSAVFG